MNTFNYLTGAFIGLYHCILLTNLSKVSYTCLFPWFAFQFGIHAGFHRWISHNSYKPNRIVGFIICLFGCLGFQYGPIWWASHHKKHHAHCDSLEDVHTPNKSWFLSHVGWLVSENVSKSNKDLILKWKRTHPEIVWLNNFYGLVNVSYLIILYFFGYSITNYYICPVVLTWHATWSTNSFCHKRSPNLVCSPCDNFIVGIVNLGEGFHKEHHTCPQNVCHGFRKCWQIDIVYVILFFMSKIGLVSI
jgi:stearoyl-CoA desaturase (delta-9 desaturase)